MKKRILALTLALSLLLPSCGGVKATTIHLKRTEGTVGVSDDAGKDVEPRDDLGLYSGYRLDTRSESFAWIDLDEVKLTKLDEDSEIEITKDGKALEIEVLSGSLFFNVTEPLADDETMTIRSSTMAVGIRGTCGWVSLSKDEETLSVYLLEGKVECTAGENSATVTAGEMAVMTAEGEITVTGFGAPKIPDFVLDELEAIQAEAPADIEDGTPIQDEQMVLLVNQTAYDGNGNLFWVTDYNFDEQGYILRKTETTYPDTENRNIYTKITTFDYDGEGHCWQVNSDGSRQDYPCMPGSCAYTSASSRGETEVISEPLLNLPDIYAKVSAGGRLNYSDFPGVMISGYYAIYTMDDNGNPIRIETYSEDGTLTGTCALEWDIIG